MGYIRLDVDRVELGSAIAAFTGLEEAIEDIDNVTLFKGLEAGGQILLDAVKAKAPVRTGTLKKAMRMNRHLGATPYVDIRFSERKKKKGGARYWWLVENGHGGPKPAPAHPFLEPAISGVEEQAMNAVVESIANELFNGW